MSLEDAIMGGIVFKGKKEGPKKDENKVKTKAKKTTYIKGTHGSGATSRHKRRRQGVKYIEE